jgi:deazaflavin-dependent oxidoreductase (nitroreductase family)
MSRETVARLLDDELRATIECRLVTIGRRTGQPREIRIWFSAAGDRLFFLAQNRERAHWVRNIAKEPKAEVRLGTRRFEGRGSVLEPTDPDDRVARDRFAAKYGTKYLGRFLREALPVAVDVEREID